MIECPNLLSFIGRKLDPRDLLLKRLILLMRDPFHGSPILSFRIHVSASAPEATVASNVPKGSLNLSQLPIYLNHAARYIKDGEVVYIF